MVIDDTGSVEGIYAFIYCTKWRSGQLLRMPYGLTTLKDRAIQYKSGALLTQLYFCSENSESEHNSWKMLKQNATPLRTTPEPEDADRRTNSGAAVPGWGRWAADTESIKVSAFSTQPG